MLLATMAAAPYRSGEQSLHLQMLRLYVLGRKVFNRYLAITEIRRIEAVSPSRPAARPSHES